MLQMLQIFGDNSSGLGALGISASSFVVQLITFLLAILILRKWAFKPITRILRERREAIEKGVSFAEEMQKEKNALEAKATKALHEARVKADEIIAEAHDQSRRMIQAAEDKAKVKAESMITLAEDRIKQDANRARKQLEHELVGLISDTTEAIIGEKVDAKKDAALIDQALKGRVKA